MKATELSDLCPDGCPIYKDGICPGGMACYGGAPVEPPCVCFDDDTDVEEWISDYWDGVERYEAMEDKKIAKEKARIEKNKIKAARRRESRLEVWHETAEIKRLRKEIAANNVIVSFAESMTFAFNATNEMFKYPERKSVNRASVNKKNEQLKTRIQELEKIKKAKLAALRKRRNNRPLEGK
jgi:hypothetical protein